ncbi:MAG TPA: thioredoxin family protein [Pirellulaceae bacterium]|nr:thioredoxin family protein [Pirellulaceae bacterium]
MAGVDVRGISYDETVKAKTASDGSFELAVKSARLESLVIIADDVAGDRMGSYRSLDHVASDFDAAGEIRLGPVLRITAHVADREGAPAAGVEVGVVAKYARIASDLTDAEGKAALRLPAGTDPAFAYAWKRDMGFDYQTGVGDAEAHDRPEWIGSGSVRFQLAKTRLVQVRLVDEAGAPLVGADVQPWLLRKPGEAEDFNVSSVPALFRVATDEAGVASFHSLPNWNERSLTFWPRTSDFDNPRIEFDPRLPDAGIVTAKLNRLVPASGRVLHEDGRPAAGIEVVASGKGFTSDHERKTARTNAEGRFAMRVAPEMLYMFIVKDKEWGAPAIDGVALRTGSSVENLEFRLTRGTRVHGRVTVGPDEQPVVGTYVFLQQMGRSLSQLGDDVLTAPPGLERRWVAPSVGDAAKTNAEGRYEFFVGPGDYSIMGPSQAPGQKVTVNGETDILVDLAAARPEIGPLAGTVVTGSPPTPVPDAKLEGYYRAVAGGRTFTTVTDEGGRFAAERRLHPMTLIARSADGTLAGIVEIGPDDATTTIAIAPLVSAHGRLIDESTGEAMAGRQIRWGRRIHDGENESGPFRDAWGATETTDEAGRFRMAGLVVGQKYSLSLMAEDGSGQFLPSFTPNSAEEKDLGDIAATPPYVPPTFEERVEKLFPADKTPVERYEAALEKAKSLRQHVLVLFVDRENSLAEAWFRLRLEDDDLRSAAYAFQVLHVDVQGDGTSALADRLGITLKDDELPLWAFRDMDEEEIEQGSLPRTEEAGFDRAAILTTLAANAPEPLDARSLLKDALAEAKASNRRVIVQETATWCGPCHLLAHFLERHRALWEQDYIWVRMDERWNGSAEVMNGIQEGPRGGIPWFAILDSDGKSLATSDGPDGNIGFPSEPVSIEHFMSMLSSTKQRMSDAQLEELRKDLEPKE